MRRSTFLGLTTGILLGTLALVSPAHAQSAPAPRFVNVDANGVDLTTGLVSFTLNEGGIGAGEGAVQMQRIWAQQAGITVTVATKH